MPRTRKEETRVSVSAAVMPNIESEILAIAALEDRSKSKIVEKLLKRGIAAYNRDGSLDEPGESDGVVESHGKPVKIFSDTPQKKKKSVK